ncbi:hypothetical protein ACEPAF_798 [Sanghuangporus sanghuang]
MFASARTAAVAPLTSPSLKHVFELMHTAHVHAHAHGPLVGLGIRVSPTKSSSSTLVGSAPPNDLHMPSGSGQPAARRPVFRRTQNSSMTLVPPTPRLQATATLPLVFSPLPLTTTGNHSLLAEEYLSDDNGSSENREAIATGSQSMANYATCNHRFATTNHMRSTLHSTLLNNTAHAIEVERIGLGISGLSLNAFTSSRIDSESVSSVPIRNRKRMTARPRRVGFSTRAYVIGSLNRSIDDGYNADAETDDEDGTNEGVLYMRHNTNLALSRINGLRSCNDRVHTPFYAPNGGVSWL